ncbi:phosphoribosylglycinamide formyltransferase [Pseudomonas sp. B21-048]|uniref:phosphoribosylglycinamide formyltransferase n=1 Tax=Pseudomonas sp. B21-048 TaxID=2895490 RepID=UPI002160746D|nr:phosphoribosylglycinamide formyltransferase [Pseudomonas sp. B21-048]UVK96812.1 phosphoribosylglycinamide formyltransferase [Pseudomonas sp. B21-048]
MKKIAFLFSGRGSLIDAVKNGIEEAKHAARLALVITNNASFDAGADTRFSDVKVNKVIHSDYPSRAEFEREIAILLEGAQIDVIVLGGFRRIFSSEFVSRFGSRTINTHPSILPAFPGDKAQRRALEAGVKITGATVHFINDEVDAGPIIDQGTVRITSQMTEAMLREEIICVEQSIICTAVAGLIDEQIFVEQGRVVNKGVRNGLPES